MCPKNTIQAEDIEMDSSDSDSDVSMTDSDSESEELDEIVADNNQTVDDSDNEDAAEPDEEEEEDEVIKAIRRNAEHKRDHPPPITCEDYITDISFHPHNDILAVATIVGDVVLYKYSNEQNDIVNTLELHTKACRDIEFSHDGKIMFSTSKDKSIMLTDVETGKLQKFYDKAHDDPLYCLTVLDEHIFATGDDEGMVKLWDVRANEQIYRIKRNEAYISDICTNEAKKYLLVSSGDGSLLTVDLHNRKYHMQTEEYDDELKTLALFRTETKLVSGSSRGKLYIFNWNEFGLHSDIFPGTKYEINALIPITENIAVTACEDGSIRATHLFPHRHLGIVGQHDLSVECLDICNNGQFIASVSVDNDIKFWNIQYFEDFEKVSNKHKKHEKKKELANNLPSSKVRNATDFFSDL